MKTITYNNTNKFNDSEKKNYEEFNIIKTRNFFLAYIVFVEFCKKRNLYKNGFLVNELVFMNSKVYGFFMKISHFIIENKVINVPFFIKYILSGEINFREWNTQSLYLKYLDDLFNIEPPEDGFYRTLKFLERWSEETGKDIGDFFVKSNENFFIFKLENKIISPWFVYSSEKTKNFLLNIDKRKFYNFDKCIDEKRWERKIFLYKDKVKIFSEILRKKGL